MEKSKNSIYFITTYEKGQEKFLVYSTQSSGFSNFKNIYSETTNKDGIDYIISVNSFDIAKDIQKNKEDDKYKLNITLKYKSFIFSDIYEGEIQFEEKRNKFIYDFKFNEKNSNYFVVNIKSKPPTNVLQLSYKEKFR